MVLNSLNITPLYKRHLVLFSKYLHKLLKGVINCPGLSSLIRFKINNLDTRNSLPLYPIFSNKNNTLNSAHSLTNAGSTVNLDYFFYLSIVYILIFLLS